MNLSYVQFETHHKEFQIFLSKISWGLLGPVSFKSYHCVPVRNRFALKLYVLVKNIVLSNIMCEINWIVIRA